MRIIKVKDLRKSFGKTEALKGISFEIKKGEIVGFLGPNGAGKTTTTRCLMNFLYPDSGSISILGLDSIQDSAKIKEEVGFLAGEVHLFHDWTGLEHINFVRNIRKKKSNPKELISLLNFDTSKKAKDLSTGNKQKLGLILTLMHNPKIIILDEPTTGLDPLLQHKIYELLKARSEKGATIFMSSHYLTEVEQVCKRVIAIKDGVIISDESIAELQKKKIFTVKAYFKNHVSKDKLKGLEITKTFTNGIEFVVKGNINSTLKQLGTFDLKDLEINHSSLDDIFMEFYK